MFLSFLCPPSSLLRLCLSVGWSTRLPACLPVCLSVCKSVCLYLYLCLSVSVCLCVCLCLCLYLSVFSFFPPPLSFSPPPPPPPPPPTFLLSFMFSCLVCHSVCFSSFFFLSLVYNPSSFLNRNLTLFLVYPLPPPHPTPLFFLSSTVIMCFRTAPNEPSHTRRGKQLRRWWWWWW